ncbi:MAG: hypothetical protein L3J17_02075 [Candidatus Jettenia sp.]|nr:MAG: hypothetical protein L3J17_02075 [Candidatus Jettenia sp.]
MPITKELENIRKFESVGFTHEQAEILAEALEQSHIDGQQSLKDFITTQFKEIDVKFKNLHSELDNKFKDVRNEINSLELRIKASHTDLLMKIFGIVVGCTSIAIAISKVWD